MLRIDDQCFAEVPLGAIHVPFDVRWPGHLPGQHVDVRLTAEDGYSAERSYSIASAPGEPLQLTVERLDNGEVSPYLTDELRPGDGLVVLATRAGLSRVLARCRSR